MEVPTPDQARAELSALDARQSKIVAGVFAKMVHEPNRAREREWVSQQLVDVTVMAGEFDADSPDQAIRAVQTYLQAHSQGLLRASYLLFQRVGLDLKEHVQAGFSFDDAMHCALGYLPAAPAGPGD